MQFELLLNENDEVWKTVAGFNRYECSTLGRFRRRKNGKILKLNLGNNGYLRAQLKRNDKQECKLAHRLLAETFLPKPIDPLQRFVNHRNKIKTDNKITNLEWVTQSENQKHSWNGRRLSDRKICEGQFSNMLPAISGVAPSTGRNSEPGQKGLFNLGYDETTGSMATGMNDSI